MPTPFRKYFGLAIECYSKIVSLISILVGSCHPAAILARIAFLVVDTVKGRAFEWDRKHIFGESLKGSPLGTNSYPSRAISCVVVLSLVIAALIHADPNLIAWGAILAVSGPCLANAFCAGAPTAFCRAARETAAKDILHVPTIALALPYALAGMIAAFSRRHHKRPIPHSDQVRHLNSLYFVLSAHFSSKAG